MPKRKKIIAVIGDSRCSEEVSRIAEEVGFYIAKKKAILICGGYGGVMEAACRGAKRGGGITIGILSGKDPEEANRYIDIPIVTGMRDARNAVIARTAQGVVAVSGSFGTLSEIAFSLLYAKPLVGIGTWKLEHSDSQKSHPLKTAKTPRQAIEILWDLVQK